MVDGGESPRPGKTFRFENVGKKVPHKEEEYAVSEKKGGS